MQFPEYDNDREAVIARMKAAGVTTITVGVDLPTSVSAIAFAALYPDVLWATVGIHPTAELTTCDVVIIKEIERLASHARVVAVGECGLDYYRLQSVNRAEQIARQKELFLRQKEIARAVNKPLMIHCRPSPGTNDAYEDLITILEVGFSPEARLPYIVHFFVGSRAIAEQLLALGCYVTFGGVISFARDYDEVIRSIPLERILLETDAPFVTPAPYRGTRNEPTYIVEVAQKMAAIRGIDYDTVCAVTRQTAQTIFDIS